MDEQLRDKDGAAHMPKRMHIKTYGCQMNVYDSERISDTMNTLGYKETDEMVNADLIVLNTCHIREKAAEKVYSDLGRIRKIKAARTQAGKKTIIAVAGCVAQAEGAEIQRRAPIVDIVVGPQSFQNLTHLVFRAEQEGSHIIDTNFPAEGKFANLIAKRAPRSCTAFLTIQEGCDKFCTFCVVPYTRGVEYSRSPEELIEEARELVANGVRELTLLGQNVNAYHGETSGGETYNLARLLADLADIDGLRRLRYTTSHPNDMTDDLIEAHRNIPKLMPYLHLPFQSGSDRILAAMNRKHTVEDYRKIITRLRAARPDIALSTDIIVGFPGETDEDFSETLKLVDEIGFAQAYSFKYSPRPGTTAASLEDQVPEDVKSARLTQLQSQLSAQQSAFNAACVGNMVPVLLEKPGRREGQLVGRSPYLQAVHVDNCEAEINSIINVVVTNASRNSLTGVIKKASRSDSEKYLVC